MSVWSPKTVDFHVHTLFLVARPSPTFREVFPKNSALVCPFPYVVRRTPLVVATSVTNPTAMPSIMSYPSIARKVSFLCTNISDIFATRHEIQ